MTTLRSALLRVTMALALAFALWLFVDFTQNPETTSAFDDLPVEFEGLAPDLLIVDNDGQQRTSRPTLAVTVDADAETLSRMTASDLRAFVDLSDRGPGEHSVPVNVVPTRSGLQRVRFSPNPAFLLVRIDQEITRTVPLMIELAGSVPFGFEAGTPRVISSGVPVSDVLVRGPAGRVERVALARISANIDQLTANINSSRTPDAVTSDGLVVTGVAVEPQTVNLEVPIRSSVGVKRVPVVPQVAGEPGSGFVVTGVAVDPQLVTLTGSSGPLDEVESVLTVPVNLSGATRTFTRTVVLVEPVNARIGFGEPTNAVVTVQIAPVVRPFQVSLPAAVQVTDIPPGLLVSLSPQVIQVSLSGTSSQLAQLDATQLAATVSARGLSEGSYSLVPTLTLPDGVRLAAPPPSVTVTLRLPPTATPSPTERPVTETTTTTPTTPTTTAASTPTATTPTTPTLTTPTP